MKFIFKTIEEEIEKRTCGIFSPSSVIEKSLIQLCETRWPSPTLDQIKKTIIFAKSLKMESDSHPPLNIYFCHPLRTAHMAVSMHEEIDIESTIICILHNVYEISALAGSDLEQAGYSQRIIKAISTLTIDREHQFEKNYITGYYKAIESFSTELSLIKCMDKLDNVLSLEVMEDGATKTNYLDISLQFVVPMAYRLMPAFGEFFSDVIERIRSAGTNRALKKKYDAFILQESERTDHTI